MDGKREPVYSPESIAGCSTYAEGCHVLAQTHGDIRLMSTADAVIAVGLSKLGIRKNVYSSIQNILDGKNTWARVAPGTYRFIVAATNVDGITLVDTASDPRII